MKVSGVEAGEPGHDRLVDIRGLCCAAPVLRLSKEFRTMRAGEIALVVSDKCSMMNDIPAFCAQTKHVLLGQGERDGLLHFWIRKT